MQSDRKSLEWPAHAFCRIDGKSRATPLDDIPAVAAMLEGLPPANKIPI